MEYTQVWIGHNLLKAKVIEWSDDSRSVPIAFLVQCPYCRCKQWARTDNFYTAYDGTTNNLKCKKCDRCKPELGSHWKRKIEKYKTFHPKCTGWDSIFYKQE